MDKESDVGSSEPGSGRDTPRSMDQDTYRSDTPGTMPIYQYSKDELYELENSPPSRVIPDCLDREFIVDNVWDPERWFRSFSGGGGGSAGGSRGPSPLNSGEPPFRERRGERRHSTSEKSVDPKERLKEEKDGIILSPQRRSFGTGCHVTHQPLLQRALSNIVDNDRRENRRIGSGRIQIDRDRGSEREYNRTDQDRGGERERGDTREFRRDRGSERDNRDFRDRNDRGQDRENRDFRNVREIERGGERERDNRDYRGNRDRFERDDRDRDRRYDRDRMFISRRDLDDRAREKDFRDFSGRQYSRRDRHHHKEEEPEWFSSGPISKSDTIELHGFEKEKERLREELGRKGGRRAHEEEDDVFDHDKSHGPDTGISVADRNGSLETNESSSPETNPSDQEPPRPAKTPPSNTLFDFNDFFKYGLPGLADDQVADTEPSSIGGSRFYQLYRMNQSAGSRENSRRSSIIEDEFGYLNELLNGSKSPVIPSPPPPTANAFDPSVFLSPFASSDKQHNLEFGTVGPKLSNLNSTNPFVTALMNNTASLEKNRNSPPVMKNSPQDTEAKLKAILFGRAGIDSNPSSGSTTPGFNSPLNVPGKVKTVAELEGEMQPSGGKPQRPGLVQVMTPPSMPPRASPGPDSGDMSAFNKLMSLMQAGTAKTELPIKIDQQHQQQQQQHQQQQQRPPSPLASMAAHLPPTQLPHIPQPQQPPPPQQPPKILQKQPEPIMLPPQNARGGDLQFGSVESFAGPLNTPTSGAPPHGDPMSERNAAQKQFLQALQRNKEQQLQIRNAALHNMRLQNPPTGQSGPAQPLQMAPPSQQAPPQPGVQPVRRLSSGDPIMNFVKANPTIITKPASPTPPPTQQPRQPMMNMVAPGGTPRGPSPSPILQTALLSQQNPGSPRVPSPIMFSQQPPMHLSAPSPIHPSQGGPLVQSPTPQTANTSTTNTIRPPPVPRVPSPQELIAHTQAILQNALIKKQLEDQKERFYKKQQERGKSPNPGVSKALESIIGCSGAPVMPPSITSTPVASKPAVNVAFTPTSVIRKMHSEKASEKEKQRRDSADLELQDKYGSSEKQGPLDMRDLIGTSVSDYGGDLLISGPSRTIDQSSSSTTSIPPLSVVHTIPPPPLPNQVLPNILPVVPGVLPSGLPSFNTNPLTHLPPPPPHVSTHLPPPLLSPGAMPPPPPPLSQPQQQVAAPPTTSLVTQEQIDAAKSQQLRQMIGQQQIPIVSTSLGGRPIVKGIPVSSQGVVTTKDLAILQQQQHQQQQQQQRPIMGTTTSPAVTGVDVAKLLQQQRQFSASPSVMTRTPTTPTTPYGIPITGRVPLQSTPIMAQQPPAPGSNQILMQQMISGGNPRAMGQLSGLGPQPRVLDPRGIRPPMTGGMVPQMLSPRNMGGVPTSLPNASFNAPFNPHLTPLVNPLKNGPISPVSLPLSMVTNGNNNFTKQDNVNFVKWFGPDVLKNQLPTMPPLPVTGQKVLTLDEIERI